MPRSLLVKLWVLPIIVAAGTGRPALAAEVPERAPLLYEVQIDGENFLVEQDRATKVQSQRRPGVTYEVAVRVAPMQRYRLKGFQFDYDRQTKLDATGSRQQPGVKLSHELGFTMLITSLGGALAEKEQKEALKILADSTVEAYQELKAAQIEVSPPREQKLAGVDSRAVTIRYRDARNFPNTTQVYLLTGPKFTASCIVQYVDQDAEDVLPLIRRTLDSFRPAAN